MAKNLNLFDLNIENLPTMKFQEVDTSLDPIRDLRKRKTQAAAEKALIELLQQKPMEAISVSELSQLAGINRKTFYNNYQSIQDVMTGIERKITRYIYSRLPERINIHNEAEIYDFLLELSEIMEPYKSILLQIIQHRGGVIMMEQVQHVLQPYIRTCLTAYSIDPKIISYITRYVCNGLATLYYEWFQKDNLTVNQVTQLAYNLIIAAIQLENYNKILE